MTKELFVKANVALVELITALIDELVNTNNYIVRDNTVVASHNRNYVVFHKFIPCGEGTITEVYSDGWYGLICMGKMGKIEELDLKTLIVIVEYLLEYSKDLNGK